MGKDVVTIEFIGCQAVVGLSVVATSTAINVLVEFSHRKIQHRAILLVRTEVRAAIPAVYDSITEQVGRNA